MINYSQYQQKAMRYFFILVKNCLKYFKEYVPRGKY